MHGLQTFWLLTESDFWTFVIPNTAFGIFGALAGPVLTTNKPTNFSVILVRIPCVLAWNWLNLFVFDLANQRSPDSVTEDSLNKPWRPIPAGHVTPAQMRRLLLAALPVVQAINFFLGAWQETSLLFGLTWMYNDLRGGDDSFLLRNMIISVAYGLYNGGSLRVACSAGHTLHETGFQWVFIITAIIFSTMHIQDLKDVAGDQARNRQSAPLVLGDSVARWTIAVPILAWSVFCPLYLRLGLLDFVLPVTVGGYVSLRTLWMRDPQADRMSWYIWAFWLISLYILPLAKDHSVFLGS